MMSEMVDRVAETLRNIHWLGDMDDETKKEAKTWSEISEDAKYFWRKSARSAINAMWDPTEEMVKKGQNSDSYPTSSAPLSCDVSQVWKIMIGEALK